MGHFRLCPNLLLGLNLRKFSKLPVIAFYRLIQHSQFRTYLLSEFELSQFVSRVLFFRFPIWFLDLFQTTISFVNHLILGP